LDWFDLVGSFWVCPWGVVCDVSSFECVTETLVRIFGLAFSVWRFSPPGGFSVWRELGWP
jgi:hypothetical protein